MFFIFQMKWVWAKRCSRFLCWRICNNTGASMYELLRILFSRRTYVVHKSHTHTHTHTHTHIVSSHAFLPCVVLRRLQGPHIIIVPKSTMGNWMRELNRWCPSLKAFKFHGDEPTRVRTKCSSPLTVRWSCLYGNSVCILTFGVRPRACNTFSLQNQLIQEYVKPQNFHVCVTSYEVAIREKGALRRINWHYVIVDEVFALCECIYVYPCVCAVLYITQILCRPWLTPVCEFVCECELDLSVFTGTSS
jgi:hypothetical protein